MLSDHLRVRLEKNDMKTNLTASIIPCDFNYFFLEIICLFLIACCNKKQPRCTWVFTR